MLKYRKFVFFVVLLLLFGNVLSQTNIDSLKNKLTTNIPDSEKISILQELAFTYSYISADTATDLIKQAVILSQNTSQSKNFIDVLLSASKIFRISGDYQGSITYGFEALKMADSLNLSSQIAEASKYLGISYYRLKEFKKALEFHNKALDIYLLLEDSLYVADCYTNIGVVFDETGELETALEYYNDALNIYKNNNHLAGMADVYNNIAGIYYQKRQNNKVVEYMDKSIEIKRQMHDSIGIIYTLINIGGVYDQLGYSDKGINNVKEGVNLASQVNLLPLVGQGYQTLYEIFAKHNDYKNAFEYYKLYSETKDSLFDIEKTKNIQELQTQYETEKQRSEIQQLKIDNLKSKNQKNIFRIVVGALLLIALMLLLFIKHRIKINAVLKEKNAQLQQLNSTQNRLMSIISHDLKAPLSAFYSITTSLKNKFDKIDRQEIDNYFNRMLNSSVALKLQLENMLNWAINQSREIKPDKNSYNLSIVAFKIVMILQEFANEKGISIENNIPESIEFETDARLLGIVLNNLIANAVKFSSENGKIIVSAEQNNKKVSIFVKDFGIGMTEKEAENLFENRLNLTKSEGKDTGLGLIVTKDIVEKLGGKISVSSRPNKGTEFRIDF